MSEVGIGPKIERVWLEAKVIRANGTIEELGVISDSADGSTKILDEQTLIEKVQDA